MKSKPYYGRRNSDFQDGQRVRLTALGTWAELLDIRRNSNDLGTVRKLPYGRREPVFSVRVQPDGDKHPKWYATAMWEPAE